MIRCRICDAKGWGESQRERFHNPAWMPLAQQVPTELEHAELWAEGWARDEDDARTTRIREVARKIVAEARN